MSLAHVLIIILSNSSGSSLATIERDFKSWETCEAARTQIVMSLDPASNVKVKSSGCFKK